MTGAKSGSAATWCSHFQLVWSSWSMHSLITTYRPYHSEFVIIKIWRTLFPTSKCSTCECSSYPSCLENFCYNWSSNPLFVDCILPQGTRSDERRASVPFQHATVNFASQTASRTKSFGILLQCGYPQGTQIRKNYIDTTWEKRGTIFSLYLSLDFNFQWAIFNLCTDVSFYVCVCVCTCLWKWFSIKWKLRVAQVLRRCTWWPIGSASRYKRTCGWTTSSTPTLKQRRPRCAISWFLYRSKEPWRRCKPNRKENGKLNFVDFFAFLPFLHSSTDWITLISLYRNVQDGK